MAEHEHTGKRDDVRNPQVQKEAAAQAIQHDPYRAQSAAETTAAETGAMHEGLESMTGKVERMAGQAGAGMHSAVSGTLKTVGTVGDEVIGVARDVLKGAVAATEEVGTGLVDGVQHVATDVLHGVGEVGGAAVHTLTGLLVGIVGGVKTVIGEAMPRHTTEAQGSSVVERKRTETERAPEEMMH